MVFHNNKDSTIHPVQLTGPFKNNIHKANDRKAQMYTNLDSDILDNGFRDGFKTQPPVDRRFRPIPPGFYCSKQ